MEEKRFIRDWRYYCGE